MTEKGCYSKGVIMMRIIDQYDEYLRSLKTVDEIEAAYARLLIWGEADYPQKRKYDNNLVHDIRKLIDVCVKEGDYTPVIGLEQFDGWTTRDVINHLVHCFAINDDILIELAVPINRLAEIENRLEMIKQRDVDIVKQITIHFLDDYVICITDQRSENTRYAKLFENGVLKVVLENEFGYDIKETCIKNDVLKDAVAFAKRYVSDFVRESRSFTEDDRIELKCFRMNPGMNMFGYNQYEYGESGEFFTNKSKYDVINRIMKIDIMRGLIEDLEVT